MPPVCFLICKDEVFLLPTADNSQFVFELVCVAQDIVKVLDAVTVDVDSSVLNIFTGLAF